MKGVKLRNLLKWIQREIRQYANELQGIKGRSTALKKRHFVTLMIQLQKVSHDFHIDSVCPG